MFCVRVSLARGGFRCTLYSPNFYKLAIFPEIFDNLFSQNPSEMHYFTCKNYKVSAKCTKNPPPAVELFQKSASSTRHQDERANISDRVFVLREVRDILVDRYFHHSATNLIIKNVENPIIKNVES